MSKPTIKSLTEQLANEKRLRIQAEDANIPLQSKLKGSPKVQEQLNMANGTVADLMKEVERLKSDNINSSNLLNIEINLLQHENNKLKSDYDKLSEQFKEVDMTATQLATDYAQIKSDYALLEEKYYTKSDNYTELNKEYKALQDKFTEISAENYALKQEIERTNRHINLAENQLHREQQPTVINHYHNCVINK